VYNAEKAQAAEKKAEQGATKAKAAAQPNPLQKFPTIAKKAERWATARALL
jgi:hypothetical protein